MKTLTWLVGVAGMIAFGVGRHGTAEQGPAAPTTGIVTLWAKDPIACTFGFRSAEYGGIFQDFMQKNKISDITCELYNKGAFTVGIEGGRKGAIVDLGTRDALQKKYGYEEAGNGGQGFASIRRQAGEFVILQNYEKQTVQLLAEAADLGKSDHAPVVEDHVYLARVTNKDTGSRDPEVVVKLLVLSYDPGRSVTFRWAVIE